MRSVNIFKADFALGDREEQWISIRWLFCVIILYVFLISNGCERFYEPDLGNGIRTEEFYIDESEYRSAAMGLYNLQQKLVEQMVVLGELRADLLKITDNADNDLREIYTFNVSPGNKYASPRDFYRLIAACNSFIRKIEYYHPQVIDKNAPVDNYDRYYGEALCMRAWAYFNAARIYWSIPYIPDHITGINEIEDYVNSPKTILDSIQIIYAPDGYDNDTIFLDEPITLEKAYLELPAVIDTFTQQLKSRVKAVGVNHRLTNNDVTWDATVWGTYSMQVLLGQMYLTLGDYTQAMFHFSSITNNLDAGFGTVRFGLDNTFRNANWKQILSTINPNEHILVLKFNKADRQQNGLQYLFSNLPPNTYQIKPTRYAVNTWETIWDNFRLIDDPLVQGNKILDSLLYGTPGDFYRGCRVSYNYFNGAEEFTEEIFRQMLEYKRVESNRDVNNIMDGADTVVTKYSYLKDPYAHDADYIIYRAASVHLYAAEIYVNWKSGASVFPEVITAERYLNNGNYLGIAGGRLGVRGRVGFADGDEFVTVSANRIYLRDPFTNKVKGTLNITSFSDKQKYLEEKILEERARELAFEGERFYDLMRISKRREDNTFLANRVASKFDEPQREIIRNLLMDEKNWYLPFFLETGDDE